MAPNKTLRRSCTASSRRSSRITRSNISSATTTTTSRKPMCRPPIRSSRRTARSTSTSSRCAWRRPRRCCRARDAIVVATVSAIYGLGAPEDYLSLRLILSLGEHIDQRQLIRHLTDLQYARNEFELTRGAFRVRGEVVDVFPAEVGHRGVAHRAVRWRYREADPVRPADRRDDAQPPALHRLSEDPLRHHARARAQRRRYDQGRAQGTAGSAVRAKTSWWKHSAWRSAPSSTWR